MAIGIGRRQFISALGWVAATWPLAVRAQQPALPVIGFLNGASYVDAFRQALDAAGFVEGHNVTVEYRWAKGQYDRLPALATDLVLKAAPVLGRQVQVVNASSESEIETAFATFAREKFGAIMVGSDAFLVAHRERVAKLAARYALPAIYVLPEQAVAGGLMSYGASQIDAYRQAGAYTGRILKGEKPADLPVMLPTKFELVINLKTAKELGIEVPPDLSARADQVIE